MPEFRDDCVTGRRVIVASERSERPGCFSPRSSRRPTAIACPFCPGAETETPHEVFAFRDPHTLADGAGWRLRVVPNKFPAVTSQAALDQPARSELFGSAAGLGMHEVIIEAAEHIVSTSEMRPEQIANVFTAYRERLLTIRDRGDLPYVSIFKNVGEAAGASLDHTHSQLIALPFVPPTIGEELSGAAVYFAKSGSCVFCQLIAAELAAEERIVAANEDFVTFCPFASRFPFEMWIIPRVHHCWFEQSPAAARPTTLAMALRDAVRRLEQVLDEPAYNYWLHSGDWTSDCEPSYHWRVQLVPRLARLAGFELAGGCYINPVPPETAAAALRNIALSP